MVAPRFFVGLDAREAHYGIRHRLRRDGDAQRGRPGHRQLGMAVPIRWSIISSSSPRTPSARPRSPFRAIGDLRSPMMTPINKQAYPDMDKFWDDLGNAYKKAVRGFADAGCRYLQLDEVFIAMLCDPSIAIR